MPEPDDQEIDLLLARGRLTENQRDAVFGAVLGTVGTKGQNTARPTRWLWGGLATGVLALGGLALFFGSFRAADPKFRSKGDPPGLVSMVECEGAQLVGCPLGSRLLFRPSRTRGFLAAFARPVDGGERVWYFAPEHPIALEANVHASGYLRQTVLIGPEHRPGRYRLHLLQLAAPTTKVAVVEAGQGFEQEQVLDLVIK